MINSTPKPRHLGYPLEDFAACPLNSEILGSVLCMRGFPEATQPCGSITTAGGSGSCRFVESTSTRHPKPMGNLVVVSRKSPFLELPLMQLFRGLHEASLDSEAQGVGERTKHDFVVTN